MTIGTAPARRDVIKFHSPVSTPGRPSTHLSKAVLLHASGVSMSRRRLASLLSAAFLLACAALPAAAQRGIAFDAYALPESGTVAIPVRQGDVASGAFADLDAATDGALSRAVAAADFKGRSDRDRKSTRLNSSHVRISYAVFCLKKKKRTD